VKRARPTSRLTSRCRERRPGALRWLACTPERGQLEFSSRLRENMNTLKFITSIFIVLLLIGCENSDQSTDRCLDQALAQCTPVGVRECGLSRSASDTEFDKCPQYVACESKYMALCMKQ
jgi:hypothetical protein